MTKVFYSEFYPPEGSSGIEGTTTPFLSEQRVSEIAETVEAVLADSILSRNEKIRILIPLNDELEVAYANLFNRAQTQGVSTANLTATYNAWVAYRNALSPAWNDTTQNTTIVRDDFRTKITELTEELQYTPSLIDEKLRGLVDAISNAVEDTVLSRDEKIRILIPLNTRLDTQYTSIVARAALFSVSSVALTAAKNAWQTYRNGLSPAWNNTTLNTTVVRDTFRTKIDGYVSALEDLLLAVSQEEKAKIDTALSDSFAALTDAASALAAADGKIDIFYSDTAPNVNTSGIGDIWVNTTGATDTYFQLNYNPSTEVRSWIAADNNPMVLALISSQNAQTTADGKATVFYQDAAPSAGAGAGFAKNGDLWVDTNDASHRIRQYRAGSGWVVVADETGYNVSAGFTGQKRGATSESLLELSPEDYEKAVAGMDADFKRGNTSEWTGDLAGSAATVTNFSSVGWTLVNDATYGYAIETELYALILAKQLVRVAPNRIYRIIVKMRTTRNDTRGTSLYDRGYIGAYGLDKTYGYISGTGGFASSFKVADGIATRSITCALTAGAGIDTVLPAGTVYLRPGIYPNRGASSGDTSNGKQQVYSIFAYDATEEVKAELKTALINEDGRLSNSKAGSSGLITGATLVRSPLFCLSSIDNGTSARIDVAAHTIKGQGIDISYPAGSFTGVAFNASYWIYAYDPTLSGGAVTYVRPNNATAFASDPNYVFVGIIKTVQDGGAAPTPPPAAPPGYDRECVSCEAYLPSGKRAGEVNAGDHVLVLSEDGNSAYGNTIKAHKNIVCSNGIKLISASGISLTCSPSTPLTAQDGSTITAAEAELGREVCVLDKDGMRWEPLVEIYYVGMLMVSRISADNGTYFAGDERDRYMATHNAYMKP